MNRPLHASWYADAAIQRRVEVIENIRIARDTYRLRFACPEMARRFLPGQFLMLRLAGFDDPLIGRPLALYDTVLDAAKPNDTGSPEAIDVVYLVKGKLTSRLMHVRPGQAVEVWGPLGNGFLPQAAEHLIMVAGGIGQTPFPALAREYLGQRRYGDPPRDAPRAERVTLCYGARTADLLAGVEDFERIGVDVRIGTDDGTRGRRAMVTELLEELLDETTLTHRVVCCGPEPMMEAVSHIAARRRVACQVSLETPMACGVGICFTCVARVRDETGDWDYKRTCVEGPVFDSTCIVW
jgi:dihydroorotate dehydrogenase electron transfer subunit